MGHWAWGIPSASLRASGHWALRIRFFPYTLKPLHLYHNALCPMPYAPSPYHP
ncbi:hypothetical protein [Nostoc sp. CMAA1605]|uniref:hypothetical protein n=1 Tax=Nostoc sp. CMAA1605 TaxID=2055159 RepID=UPI001F24D7FF|nr:hypothetical protein [Nostoc sp. CMAA1605]